MALLWHKKGTAAVAAVPLFLKNKRHGSGPVGLLGPQSRLGADALFRSGLIQVIAPCHVLNGHAAGDEADAVILAFADLCLFCIAYGQTAEDIMALCRAAVDDPEVSLEYLQSNEHSAVARMDRYSYERLCAAMQRYNKDVLFVPAAIVAATDAHKYEQICDVCLRCSPFMVSAE